LVAFRESKPQSEFVAKRICSLGKLWPLEQTQRVKERKLDDVSEREKKASPD